MTASLYIHIPFCSSLCAYCDFFSVTSSETDASLLDAFINALLCDIKEQIALFNVDHVPTVYIGGGTPSVLGAARTSRLLDGIQTLLEPMKQPPSEFTIEANPESLNEDFLSVCASKKINRISLGVQTFHEASRNAVNRHGGNVLDQRIALAKAYFPGFSADLIAGLPFQAAAVLQEDIERLLEFGPGHISLYSLILDPQTPLGKKVSQLGEAALSLPCGDEADNLWIAGRDKLEEKGFYQYEVSNFALPEKTCAHNMRYWRMENWLGAGAGASGTIIDNETGTGKRFAYPENINAYIAAPSPRISSASLEEIGKEGLIRETLLMGFRCRKGPDPLLFKERFGRAIEDCIPKTIARWRSRDFFESENSLAPSRGGLLFLNSFLRDAFGELLD
ncbi:MAG: radical SAM family heme chaperone HemW [Treponema sp.]|jgi:oxygen-independent coproporphyrinogen-3 oxidase|nr:radical SAM family heme chaperone HemW [Treponema sp.]